MKRFLLHIILTFVILDTTPLYQVLKFPSLIRHFNEHKALNQKIDFLDFLSMHYWGQDLDDNDDDKDMQLPFKKFDLHQVNYVPGPVMSAFSFKTAVMPVVKADYGPDRPQVYHNAALGSLFRPPRV